jgi:hypothetical protein
LAVSRWRNRCWKEEMKETIGEGRQIWEWEEQPREQSEEDVLCSLVFFFFEGWMGRRLWERERRLVCRGLVCSLVSWGEEEKPKGKR